MPLKSSLDTIASSSLCAFSLIFFSSIFSRSSLSEIMEPSTPFHAFSCLLYSESLAVTTEINFIEKPYSPASSKAFFTALIEAFEPSTGTKSFIKNPSFMFYLLYIHNQKELNTLYSIYFVCIYFFFPK